MDVMIFFVLILMGVLAYQVIKFLKKRRELNKQAQTLAEEKSALIEEEAELVHERQILSRQQAKLQQTFHSAKLKIKSAQQNIAKLENEKKRLTEQVNAIRFELGETEKGFDYSVPSTMSVDYNLESQQINAMLKQKREEQKALKKDNTAFSGNGGELLLRAFECEANTLLSKVTPKNLSTTRNKLITAHKVINRLGERFDSTLSDEVLYLKIDELSIAHAFNVVKQKEQEEQRAIREQMREEERARKEYEKTLRDAEKEERIIQKAMEKAQRAMDKATAEQRVEYEAQLAELQAQLTEAESKHQRAESMAQLTKRGHVYIISNIGSFGESMFKIGMTRRLEPMDRVKELGDASVPFPFDVHGMIFSDDAPALEAELHRIFSDKRTNKINLRKEFFNVSIQDIKAEVEKLGLAVELTLMAEANEYMETLNIQSRDDFAQVSA